MKMGSLGLFHEFQMLRNCHHISVYLETQGLACWKECAQEFEREERGAVTRVWGFLWKFCVFWRTEDLVWVFCGWGGIFLVFSQGQCCTSKDPPMKCRRLQVSFLSLLFSSFLSLSSLGEKGRLGGWPVLAGGTCLSWFMTSGLPEGARVSSEHLPWVCYPSLKSSKRSLPGGTSVS